MLLLLVRLDAAAQLQPEVQADSMAFDSFVTATAPCAEPSLVWQRPVPATITGLAVAVGTSPLLFDPMRRQNILIRERSQIWRRNSFDYRQFHFDNLLQWAPMASVAALSWAGVSSRHDGWPLMQRVASTLVVNTVITQTIKHSVTEWRPDRSASNSFPSGHTAFAFSGAELLRLEYGHTSPWIAAAGFAVASLTGLMRIYNDRHWAGDVLAGAGIGILAADLSFWLNDLIDRKLWKQ